MKNISITILGKSIHICSKDFDFFYYKEISNEENANNIDEVYHYFGGLQCNFEEGTKEFKELHNKLCEFSNIILKKEVELELLKVN